MTDTNSPMSSTDLIKNSVLNTFSGQTLSLDSWPTIVFSLLLAFFVGLFIYWVYQKNYRGVMFSNSFGMTLVMMTLITTPVVMCIKSSLQLSLGMVGALSIVRFRTAVKDPLDTAYMFWALTMGILLGAGQFFLTALVTVGIAVLVFLMNRLNFRKADSYLLVLHYVPGCEGALMPMLRGIKQQRLKSKTVTQGSVEMTLEVRLERQDALLNKLLSLEGVQDATLVAYQNETL